MAISFNKKKADTKKTQSQKIDASYKNFIVKAVGLI